MKTLFAAAVILCACASVAHADHCDDTCQPLRSAVSAVRSSCPMQRVRSVGCKVRTRTACAVKRVRSICPVRRVSSAVRSVGCCK